MKRIWTILLVVLLAMPAFTTRADKVEIIGDTLVAVSGSDTVRLSGAAEIQKYIARMLDDTVATLGQPGDSLYNAEEQLNARLDKELEAEAEFHERWAVTAEEITMATLFTIAAIVFITLMFRYLHRRRKYKMVEKAIENNYTLPDGVFGTTSRTTQTIIMPPVPDGPQPVVGTPINGAPGNAARAQATGQKMPMSRSINWMALKGGFIWAAIGVALMLAFATANAPFMVALCAIPTLIGAGKMFVAYQEQRDAVDAWNQRQAWEAAHPTPPQPEYREPEPPEFHAPTDENDQATAGAE